MNEKRETVGALSSKLLMSEPSTRDPRDVEASRQQSYIKCMLDFIEKERHKYGKDFYIEVQLRANRLMPNVFRNQFISKECCPTPTWDQTVYKYHFIPDDLEFLWTVPDKWLCKNMPNHVLEVPESEHELLKFVLDFNDGTLFKRMKQLNGEHLDSPLITQ